ncbi:MAG: PAS domain-containing sensor histidine kinase [Myxococcaceae bacterium]
MDYQKVFAHSPNAYMVVDRELRFVIANDAFCRVTDVRPAEVVGRRVDDVFPNDPREFIRSFERVLASRQPDTIALARYVDTRGRRPQEAGRERYWTLTNVPLLDDSGEVAFILQHAVDVTELHALDRDLRGAPGSIQDTLRMLEFDRQRLLSWFDQMPGFACILLGPKHVHELANAEYLQLIGREDIVGRPVAEVFPEFEEQGFIELLDRVYTTGIPHTGLEVHAAMPRPQGAAPKDVYVDFVYQPIRESDGRVIGVFVQGQDVTARKKAELMSERWAREAEEGRAWLLAILENAPLAIVIADLTGHIILANKSVTSTLQLEKEPVSVDGELFAWAGVEPDGTPTPEEDRPLRRALRGEEAIACELDWVFPDGEKGTIEASYGPVRDSSGRVIAAVTLFRDITEKKRAQAEAHRRAEFDQLLIGMVSHDLRNPLQAIKLGTASLLRHADLDERTTKAVVRIHSSAERATRMVRELLDFTQARLGGGIPVKLEALDLFDVVGQVVDELRMSYPDRELLLMEEGNGRGEWDGGRLGQVVTNLVANAVAYSPEDTPVTVTARDEGELVLLRVHNLGAPIPEDLRRRLFEPMQRGDDLHDPMGRSIGLGLFIVKHIVEAHGGAVALKSDDAGTVFTVCLPRWPAEREKAFPAFMPSI